jgi:hypothetical protein
MSYSRRIRQVIARSPMPQIVLFILVPFLVLILSEYLGLIPG